MRRVITANAVPTVAAAAAVAATGASPPERPFGFVRALPRVFRSVKVSVNRDRSVSF